jgi:hypothetical protein
MMSASPLDGPGILLRQHLGAAPKAVGLSARQDDIG